MFQFCDFMRWKVHVDVVKTPLLGTDPHSPNLALIFEQIHGMDCQPMVFLPSKYLIFL